MMGRFRQVVLTAALVALSSALSANPLEPRIEDRNLDEVIDSGFIEIGVYRDFPPFSFIDDDGKPAGVDIAIGALMAERLGVDPRWFWVTPGEKLEDDLRNAIWKGSRIDDRAVADVMLRVPYDREYSYAIDGYGLPKHEHIVFFGPYQQESWAIARDLKKTGDVRNFAIFAYEKVGVEIDSLPDSILSAAYNGRLRDNVVHYLNAQAALQGLETGEVAAVVAMRSQLDWGLRHSRQNFDVDTDGLEQLVKLRWDIGAAVKETHRELANQLEVILDEAVRDGSLAAIFKSYGISYYKPSAYQQVE